MCRLGPARAVLLEALCGSEGRPRHCLLAALQVTDEGARGDDPLHALAVRPPCRVRAYLFRTDSAIRWQVAECRGHAGAGTERPSSDSRPRKEPERCDSVPAEEEGHKNARARAESDPVKCSVGAAFSSTT